MSLNQSQSETVQAKIKAGQKRGALIRRALLASAAANAKDNKDGAMIYYTPQPVIDYMLETIAEPAAGSGAFLISAKRVTDEQD